MIRIGYACVNTALPSAGRTFRIAGYSPQRMLDTARSNIAALQRMLRWNRDHGIFLFRITSGLIPFGSHPVNSGEWRQVLGNDLKKIGGFIRANGMRVSMHPGQYSVLNSPNETYYQNTVRDLQYHQAVMELMELDGSHTIVIHGGGAYRDKQRFARVLVERISDLDSGLRRRLVLENDERVFTAGDILAACLQTGLPGVLDVFHHQVLPSLEGMDVRGIITRFAPTWAGRRQKIHYSDQEPGRPAGSHSAHVDVERFGRLYEMISDFDLDVMIEAKDKQKSVLALREAFPALG
ncbi:MAG: UV DNA damage endonuclease [Deltaproteobacteria bacterium ADurb.BinA179]|jgi:UV DNA damage endonuclease|nr:MAG: UV DNA damage endonuclease [Deltaproteobacteria bacterium ADurb.BinA179]HNU73488.1 UV DNA damage repair endonuclease UvsE [Deltaproteobacteria bacterium]HOD71214.1 UV DNA damage repair endonuclease UvsE [Deltaproteobacteria bacterium]HOE71481.1 UV DNA damage repair endonuclease UvsE [Deltaproteobacteria bacterium]HON60684.1 UV DNA damage repair endonuclease UvsE [Deltaproteobacteria bacterium]